MAIQLITPTDQTPSGQASASKTRQAAEQFEQIFVSMMMRAMRNTIPTDSLIPESTAQNIYTEMLDNEYSNLISKHGSLGLADMIVKQLGDSETSSSALNSLRGLSTPAWMLDNKFIPSSSSSATNIYLSENVNKWKGIVDSASKAYCVDSSLVMAVIARESAGNPAAVSRVGAKGLMQLMDSTATDLGVTDSFHPQQNINGGVTYLKQMLDRFNGNEELALAAYNAGPAAVDRYKGVPPFAETRQYVSNVLALRNQYRAASAQITGSANE